VSFSKTSRHTPPLTRRGRRPTTPSASASASPSPTPLDHPLPSPSHGDHSECERDRRQLLKDNKILSKQVAEITRDLEALKADFKSLAEDSDARTLNKVVERVEKVVAANHKTAQQGLHAVRKDVTALQGQQEAMVGRVTSLTNSVTLIEATQASMKELMDARHEAHREIEARIAGLEKEAGIHTPPPPHPSTMAFHLVGLEAIQKAAGDLIPRGMDPVDILRHLLRHVGMEFYMTKIQLLGVKVTEAGRKASSAVIHMTSEFHKTEALIRVKKVLGELSTQGVIAEDCFPASTLEEVRLLKYYGYQQKAQGKAAKYRVVNRGGKPILQTGTAPLGRYSDLQPPASLTKEAMEAEQAARGYQRRPREATRPPPPTPAVSQPGTLQERSSRRPAQPEQRHGGGDGRKEPPPPHRRDRDQQHPGPEVGRGQERRVEQQEERRGPERRREQQEDRRMERRHGDGGRAPNTYWAPPYWEPTRSPVKSGYGGAYSYLPPAAARNADNRIRRY